MLNEKLKNIKDIRDITNNETIIKDYEKQGKFYNDINLFIKAVKDENYQAIIPILSNGVTFHNSGKIAGIQSLDSTSHCTFCAEKIKAAEKNENIICKYCYDRKQEAYRTAALSRHYLNMFILSNVSFTVDDLKYLPITTSYFRFNSSGDLENTTHAENYVKICYAFPNIHFSLWTKNIHAITQAIENLGKPENLIIIWSNPVIDSPATVEQAPVIADYTFSVYTSTDKQPKQVNSCNGKKCSECNYKCYSGAWNKNFVIAELLRK